MRLLSKIKGHVVVAGYYVVILSMVELMVPAKVNLPLKIRAYSSRNGSLWLLTGGAVNIVLAVMLVLQEGVANQWQLGFFVSVLLVCGLGFSKLKQPFFSVEIDKQGIHYHHPYGSWHCAWTNIRHIDVAKLHSGTVQTLELPYIAITLKHKGQFIQQLLPRLAARLLIEQRELVLAAARQHEQHCANGGCVTEQMFTGDNWRDEDGVSYSGLLAMFGYRMTLLEPVFSAQLFIPISALDRAPDDFIGILRQIHYQIRE